MCTKYDRGQYVQERSMNIIIAGSRQKRLFSLGKLGGCLRPRTHRGLAATLSPVPGTLKQVRSVLGSPGMGLKADVCPGLAPVSLKRLTPCKILEVFSCGKIIRFYTVGLPFVPAWVPDMIMLDDA